MTDTAILGALVFLLGLIALVLICGAIVGGLRERAYQRDLERAYQRDLERAYADEWCRTHLKHQHDRHDHGDERKPE